MNVVQDSLDVSQILTRRIVSSHDVTVSRDQSVLCFELLTEGKDMKAMPVVTSALSSLFAKT